MPELHKLYDEATKLKDEGDIEGAVKKLEEVVEADPNYAVAHSALAVYLQQLGRDDDAIAHAVKVTELEPNDILSFTQLSVIYQRCGRIEPAERAMEHARRMQQ